MMTRLILLLFCAIYLSLCHLPVLPINLDGCKDATACFVRESCIETKTDKTKLVRFENGKLRENCDVIMQMRAFGKMKYHIMMQVNYTGSSDKIADTGVTLKTGADQFSCTKAGPTANPALFTTFSDVEHVYTEKLVFCSFMIESKDEEAIAMKFSETDIPKPTLEFNAPSQQTIIARDDPFRFWSDAVGGIICDPQMITSSQALAGEYLAHSINSYAYPPIACDAGKFMIITRADGSFIKLDIGQSLECDNENWFYNLNSVKVLIPDKEKFNLVCGDEKFCSRCPSLDLTCTGCLPPKHGKNNENCNTATCPNNQWKTEDGKLLTGEMECKQEIGNANSKNAFWYLQDGTNPIQVTKAACFSFEKDKKKDTGPSNDSFTPISIFGFILVVSYRIL